MAFFGRLFWLAFFRTTLLSLKGVFSDFMIDAVKITHDPLIPEMVLFFQISTSGQRGSLSGMMKTSQTTSISSQTTSNQPLKPDLFLLNHIVHLPNHICYLSNHITCSIPGLRVYLNWMKLG